MKFRAIAAVTAASAMTLTLSVAPAWSASHPPAPEITNVRELSTGLGGPLKVAFGPHGSVLVAEAMAGMVSSISPSGEKSVLVAAPGHEIVGVSYGNNTTYYFQNAGSDGGEPPAGLTPALLKAVDHNGNTRTITDLADFEQATDSDGQTVYGVRDASAACLAQAPYLQSMGELYSHPYSSAPARNGLYVGDAGANVILHVDNQGKVSLVKALPAEPIAITEAVQAAAAEMGMTVPDCMLGLTYWAQPVPTDITIKGNWLYYTVLPGVPGESMSAGKVYKMNLHSKKTYTVATGLNAPTGVALDHRGNIYVAELFGGGVARIVDGAPVTVLPGGLTADLAIRNGKMVLSTMALVPGAGTVVTATIK